MSKKKSFGFLSKRTEEKRTFEVLSVTRDLTDKANITHDIWERMASTYKDMDAKDPVSRTLTSITNSILHQERIIFAFSKESLMSLVETDKNIPEKHRKAFSDRFYSIIRAKLYEYRMVKLVYQGDGTKNQASAFEVIDSDLLDYLNRTVDKNKQMIDTLAYCNREPKNSKSKQTVSKGNHRGNRVREPGLGTDESMKERNNEIKELRTNESKTLKKDEKINKEDFLDCSFDVSSESMNQLKIQETSFNKKETINLLYKLLREINPYMSEFNKVLNNEQINIIQSIPGFDKLNQDDIIGQFQLTSCDYSFLSKIEYNESKEQENIPDVVANTTTEIPKTSGFKRKPKPSVYTN
jgi:hypothetical protein